MSSRSMPCLQRQGRSFIHFQVIRRHCILPWPRSFFSKTGWPGASLFCGLRLPSAWLEWRSAGTIRVTSPGAFSGHSMRLPVHPGAACHRLLRAEATNVRKADVHCACFSIYFSRGRILALRWNARHPPWRQGSSVWQVMMQRNTFFLAKIVF